MCRICKISNREEKKEKQKQEMDRKTLVVMSEAEVNWNGRGGVRFMTLMEDRE